MKNIAKSGKASILWIVTLFFSVMILAVCIMIDPFENDTGHMPTVTTVVRESLETTMPATDPSMDQPSNATAPQNTEIEQATTSLSPTDPPVTLPSEPEAEETAPPTTTSEGQSEAIKQDPASDTGDELLNALCDQILFEILDQKMTQREKAYAIYQWVASNVRYLGVSDTNDWIEGAKYALTNNKGNCYAFYSASRALLTRAGFENMEAVSTSRGHYWNIVKVDGQWRHFDATPGWGTDRFLWTGTQILEYRYYSEKYQYYISYLWDPKGYPDTN